MTGRWKELFCVEVDKCTGRGPGGEVWFQVENNSKYGRDEIPGFEAWYQVMGE